MYVLSYSQLVDALRSHPRCGHLIVWDIDEMREHVASATDREPEDVTDDEARSMGRAMDWDLQWDYSSIAD